MLHGDSTRFDDSKMPVSALNALVGETVSGLLYGIWPAGAPHDPVRLGRYATLAVSLLVSFVVFRWAEALYGLAGGLAALVCCALDPNLIAHGRLVTTDYWVTAGVLLACHSFWSFLRFGGMGRAVRASALLGAAQLTKFTAVYLYPIFLVVVAARFGGEALAELRARDHAGLRRRAAAFLRWSALFAAVSLLVIQAGYLFNGSFTRLGEYQFRSTTFQAAQVRLQPLAWLPVPLPRPFVEGLDWVWLGNAQGVGYLFLNGELRSGATRFPTYFLWAWLYKVPLALQLGLLAALFAYALRRARFHFARDEAFLLLPAGLLLLYFNLLSRAQWGLRYIIIVFPLLHVFTGSLAADWPALGRRARLGLGALGLWLTASVLSYHPHYIAYFSEVIPDRGRLWRHLSDSNLDWGQDQHAAEAFVAAHPGAVLEPKAPQAGLLVVSASKLVGVFTPPRYKWLRENFSPVGHVNYSYLVFEVSRERLRELGIEEGREIEWRPRQLKEAGQLDAWLRGTLHEP